MSSHRFGTWVCVIFAVGFFVREAPIAHLSWGKLQRDVGVGINRQLATNLVAHHGFYFRDWDHFGPSSIQTPPYPVFLATLFWIFGNAHPSAYFAALTINAILGGLCCVVTALLVRRIGGSDRAAAAAGLLMAVWPSQVFAATYVQPMVAASLLVTASCVLWRRSVERTSLGAWIGFAIVAALAAMFEPRLLPAAGVAVVAIAFVRTWPVDVRVRNTTVLLAVFAIVWLPWLARNLAVHDRLAVTTSFWRTVWAGANEHATGSDRLPITPERTRFARAGGEIDADDAVRMPMMQTDALSADQRVQLSRQPEAAREAVFRGWAMAWIGEHPLNWVTSGGVRLAKAAVIDWDHPMSRHIAAVCPRVVLAVATLAAMVLAIRRHIWVGPELAVVATSILVQVLSVATAKAAVSVEPVQIAVMSGVVWVVVRVTRNAPDVSTSTSALAPSLSRSNGRGSI